MDCVTVCTFACRLGCNDMHVSLKCTAGCVGGAYVPLFAVMLTRTGHASACCACEWRDRNPSGDMELTLQYRPTRCGIPYKPVASVVKRSGSESTWLFWSLWAQSDRPYSTFELSLKDVLGPTELDSSRLYRVEMCRRTLTCTHHLGLVGCHIRVAPLTPSAGHPPALPT